MEIAVIGCPTINTNIPTSKEKHNNTNPSSVVNDNNNG
jgi:hypothetical protein